jgi:hypothetical protein
MQITPENLRVFNVEPRGFEPLTSAVQSQGPIVALVRRCSCGLVYYWCKWVSTQHFTHLALVSAAVQRNKVLG